MLSWISKDKYKFFLKKKKKNTHSYAFQALSQRLGLKEKNKSENREEVKRAKS